MMKLKNVLILTYLGFGLLACGHDPSSSALTVAGQYIEQPNKAAKAGAAIALVNSQVILPVSSGQYAVDIDLYSHYESGQMRLSAATSPGLYIASGHTDTTLSLTEGVINNPYRLIAEGPGRYYVYLNVSAKSQGQTATRALTFIVQVGPNKKANGYSSLLKAPTGQSGVIALPAEEEIIY